MQDEKNFFVFRDNVIHSFYSDAIQGTAEIKYDDDQDNYTYTDLIRSNLVKNETGEIDIQKNVKTNNPIYCQQYVKDGTGIYSGWVSNSQKMLRRCKIRNLLVSVVKIFDTGDIFMSNIINRLCKVMISEDIGVAGTYDLILKCKQFLDFYDKYKEKKRSETENATDMKELKDKFIDIVIRLGTSKKSRITDNLLCCVKFGNKTIRNDFTQDAFDKLFFELKQNTNKKDIRSLIRNVSILMWMEKCGLNKTTKERVNIPFYSRKRKRIYIVWSWIIEISKTKNEVLGQCCNVLLDIYENSTCPLLNLIHAYLNFVLFENIEILKKYELDNKYIDTWENIQKYNVWIDSVSYDKHTTYGSCGKYRDTLFFFFRYGCKLANIFTDPEMYKLENEIYRLCSKYSIECQIK